MTTPIELCAQTSAYVYCWAIYHPGIVVLVYLAGAFAVFILVGLVNDDIVGAASLAAVWPITLVLATIMGIGYVFLSAFLRMMDRLTGGDR